MHIHKYRKLTYIPSQTRRCSLVRLMGPPSPILILPRPSSFSLSTSPIPHPAFPLISSSISITETSQAHPKYGNILASSSYDGKVLIWREQASQWQKVADFALHSASVNLVSWAPHESGCLLACASSDGSVSVLEFRDGGWEQLVFPAHGLGVNAVSWAPAAAPGSLVSSKPEAGARRRFVTGGSDNLIKIWDWK